MITLLKGTAWSQGSWYIHNLTKTWSGQCPNGKIPEHSPLYSCMPDAGTEVTAEWTLLVDQS